MNEAWYRQNPTQLEDDRQQLSSCQPELLMVDTGDGVLFRGGFRVEDDGVLCDRFDIEVELSPGSATDVPVVRETSGRIPRKLDPHHVTKPDGTLCVVLPEEYWYKYPQGLRLAAFMQGPLRSHFAGQALVLKGESWPQKEWPHGPVGRLAFYCEILETTDFRAALRLMLMLVSGKVKGHWACPCGSGKIIRDCHRQAIWNANERIPTELVQNGLDQFRMMMELLAAQRQKETTI